MKIVGDVETAHVDEATRIRLVFCLAPAVVFITTLFFLARSMLQDPDNLWHVRVGLDILASHTVPTVDTYSHTYAGHPWITHEWLGQVLLALAYSAGGWNGVVLLTVAAVALTLSFLAWYLSDDLRPTLALGLAFIVAFLVSPMYNARPYILTFPLIVVWTAELFRAARYERAPPLWLLPLLVLWANLHAAFTLGFVIAFFAFLDLLERVRFSNRSLLVRWMAFGISCPIVTLLNPYGIKAILATFTVAYGNEALPYLSEWRAFSAAEFQIHEAALLILFFGLLLSGLRTGWAKALFFVLTVHLFLIHIRFMYLFLLLPPLIMVAEVAQQFPILSTARWAFAKRDAFEQYCALQSKWIASFAVLFTILASALFMALGRSAPSRENFAEKALIFVKDNHIYGNVFNSYDMGGTLMFHDVKTYIDGRSDQLFLDNGFIGEYRATELTSGGEILSNILEEHRIDWALLIPNDQRIPFFDKLPGWNRAYTDDYNIIYVRQARFESEN